MTARTTQYIIALISFGFVLCIAYTSNRFYQTQFEIFNQSKIDGKLIHISTKNKGVTFQTNSSDVEYFFIPRTDQEGHVFEDFAKVGDIVMKESNAGVLTLEHNGMKYYYDFAKTF